jgi:hypothetical protein
MILSLLNKLMFFGTVYLLYQAYNTAGGGVTEILGDLPKIIAWIFFALAAAALLFVALLWYRPAQAASIHASAPSHPHQHAHLLLAADQAFNTTPHHPISAHLCTASPPPPPHPPLRSSRRLRRISAGAVVRPLRSLLLLALGVPVTVRAAAAAAWPRVCEGHHVRDLRLSRGSE